MSLSFSSLKFGFRFAIFGTTGCLPPAHKLSGFPGKFNEAFGEQSRVLLRLKRFDFERPRLRVKEKKLPHDAGTYRCSEDIWNALELSVPPQLRKQEFCLDYSARFLRCMQSAS